MPDTEGTSANRSTVSVPGRAERALLHDLIRWREQLARSIARNNLGMRSEEIATAVNRILFPLIFIAAAEDRRLLPAGTLARLHDRPDDQIFAITGPFADGLYKGIFPEGSHSPSQPGTPVIENLVLHNVLADLATPGRMYDFDCMSTEPFGQVLTPYLARSVRRSAAHHAGIVDTHDTVLSGGTVVPPLVLIRALADQALDTVRRNRSRREILPIRILDPACGSGTLLVSAYRHLCALLAGQNLTFEERREILAHSIHGVDISPHAVAATRMLLVLHLLENHCPCKEPEELFTLIHPVLGDLRHNILCGNALVGPDIMHDESWNFSPPRERRALNLFEWDDYFTEVRAAGGFDLIVCNPPEGPVEKGEWIQQHFQRRYSVYHRAADRSAYFIEKGLTLLRPGGTLAFVMQSRWLRGIGGSPLRGLLKNRKIEEIAEYSGTIFCSIRVRNTGPSGPITVVRAEIVDTQDGTGRIAPLERFPADPAAMDEGGWVFRDTRTASILAKIQESGTPVANFCMGESGCGSLGRADERLFISRKQRDRLLVKDRRTNDLLRPFIRGGDIRRYHANSSGKYYLLILPPSRSAGPGDKKDSGSRVRRHYPAVARYLKAVGLATTAPAEGKTPWYETRCSEVFLSKDRPKILFPAWTIVPVFTADDGRSLIDPDTGYLVTGSLFLLAVLNSRLARFWFMHREMPAGGPKARDTAAAVAGFPAHVPNLDDATEAGRQDNVETLARRMLVYHDQLARSDDETLRGSFRKKIERTDRQLNAFVYALYGLTPQEIAMVEESVGK